MAMRLGNATPPLVLMPSHNEPCTRCPEFVVRCGHSGERVLHIWDTVTSRGDPEFIVTGVLGMGDPRYILEFATRALADAEFERREEALLA